MRNPVNKAVDDIRVDESWGIAGSPAELELDRVAIFGHPISKPQQNPFEDGPIKIEIDNRSQQVINDRDEIDRFSLRRDQVLEKLSELGVLDCFQGRRDKVAQRIGEFAAVGLLTQPMRRRRSKIERTSRSTTFCEVKKCVSMKAPMLSAIRSLFLGMIAVCGIGNPSG